MNDNKFWVLINVVFGLTLCTIIGTTQLYWADHNKKIVEMIGGGVDPVAAMCAMQDDYGTMPVCLVLAAKK